MRPTTGGNGLGVADYRVQWAGCGRLRGAMGWVWPTTGGNGLGVASTLVPCQGIELRVACRIGARKTDGAQKEKQWIPPTFLLLALSWVRVASFVE